MHRKVELGEENMEVVVETAVSRLLVRKLIPLTIISGCKTASWDNKNSENSRKCVDFLKIIKLEFRFYIRMSQGSPYNYLLCLRA